MEKSLGFLLGDVSRLLRRRFDERARTIGVTRQQWRVLFTVARNEGINQGGLAELLEVEPISASRMVDRLQDAGLVERRADPDDRRAWRIHLTPAARPLLHDLTALGDELYHEATEGLTMQEQQMLRNHLEKIRENLCGCTGDMAGVRKHG